MLDRIRIGWIARKAIHLSLSIIGSMLLQWHVYSARAHSLPLFLAVIFASVLLTWDLATHIVIRRQSLSWLLKGKEIHGLSGVSYAVLGCGVAYLIANAQIAAASIMLLGVTDATAGLVGKRFGSVRLPYNHQKSVIGSLAGLAAGICFIWMWPEHWGVVLLMALAVSLFESLPLPVDDNFICPVSAALTAIIVQRVFPTL